MQSGDSSRGQDGQIGAGYDGWREVRGRSGGPRTTRIDGSLETSDTRPTTIQIIIQVGGQPFLDLDLSARSEHLKRDLPRSPRTPEILH
jgi:hypothetical protein